MYINHEYSVIPNIFYYKPNADSEDGFTKKIVEKGAKKHYGGFDNVEVWNGLTEKISEDVEQFLMKLEAIQGRPVSKTTIILNWE